MLISRDKSVTYCFEYLFRESQSNCSSMDQGVTSLLRAWRNTSTTPTDWKLVCNPSVSKLFLCLNYFDSAFFETPSFSPHISVYLFCYATTPSVTFVIFNRDHRPKGQEWLARCYWVLKKCNLPSGAACHFNKIPEYFDNDDDDGRLADRDSIHSYLFNIVLRFDHLIVYFCCVALLLFCTYKCSHV